MDALHDELIRTISEWTPNSDGSVERDTPLIASARLDSLGLFQLLVWIEKKVGRPLEAAAIDIATEWETVNAVVSFIERERKRSVVEK